MNLNLFLSKTECLSGTALKVIAVVIMTIDHIGAILFPHTVWLRIVGRLAFPVFAYMITEGCYYTKNKRKYIGLMLIVGILYQAAFCLVRHRPALNLNIMFTLAIGALLIFELQWLLGRKEVFSRAGLSNVSGFRLLVFVLTIAAAVFVSAVLPLWIEGFRIDYNLAGILLPVIIYLGSNHGEKLFFTAIGLIALSLQQGWIQWYCLFALIPLSLYNGTRGRYSSKYFFYIYYPLHLLALWGIYYLN